MNPLIASCACLFPLTPWTQICLRNFHIFENVVEFKIMHCIVQICCICHFWTAASCRIVQIYLFVQIVQIQRFCTHIFSNLIEFLDALASLESTLRVNDTSAVGQ